MLYPAFFVTPAIPGQLVFPPRHFPTLQKVQYSKRTENTNKYKKDGLVWYAILRTSSSVRLIMQAYII